MKTSRIFKVSTMALALSLCVAANAADFSKKSDEELIKLSGSVEVKDFADYELEVAKRLKGKDKKEVQAYREKLRAQYEKATENMKVKDYREYKRATHEAMKKRVEKMSEKERKESGLPLHRHMKGCKDGKDFKGKGCEAHCKGK